jgi:uncharacterized membrane protein
MPETVGGVPLHPLVVHAVVVLVPLAALGVLAVAVVPKWRPRFGGLVATFAVLGAALVPVATQSGEVLESLLGSDEAIERHSELGETLLYSAVPLAMIAVALWWIGRREERGAPWPRVLVLAVASLGVVVALGVTVQVVLIGHSGADAAWSTDP